MMASATATCEPKFDELRNLSGVAWQRRLLESELEDRT